jgi:DeoR family transcriptional regulator of aga operon
MASKKKTVEAKTAALRGAERGSQMLIEERRQYIVALAQRDGRVLVEELSQSLGISRITIRKDLDYLQGQGLLLRTHGGALPPGNGAQADPSLQRIAAAAANLVKEGQCILLDSGTTATAIARALKHFSHLTIITNAVNLAVELSGTGFEVMLTGGSLRKNSFSLVGPLAEDILFLGVDGFDLEGGPTTPNVMESRVHRAMVKASSVVVAVCDSTKFNRRSLSKIVDATAIHHVITDSGLPAETADALRSAGIKLTLVQKPYRSGSA